MASKVTSSIRICRYRTDMLILSYSVSNKFCPQTESTVLRIRFKHYYHYLTIFSEWICSTFLTCWTTSISQMKDFLTDMPLSTDRVNSLDDISNPNLFKQRYRFFQENVRNFTEMVQPEKNYN